jgi:hypothetical protein
MNRLSRQFTTLVFAMLITAVSTIVAAAECSILISGEDGNSGTSYSCTLTGEDAQYCYYDCECEGDETICEQLMRDNGLESI